MQHTWHIDKPSGPQLVLMPLSEELLLMQDPVIQPIQQLVLRASDAIVLKTYLIEEMGDSVFATI